MLMLNTSLMLAEHDLHMLDEVGHESQAPRANTVRRSHRRLTALTRLAHQVMALFL
jgi:hypothetical protein